MEFSQTHTVFLFLLQADLAIKRQKSHDDVESFNEYKAEQERAKKANKANQKISSTSTTTKNVPKYEVENRDFDDGETKPRTKRKRRKVRRD